MYGSTPRDALHAEIMQNLLTKHDYKLATIRQWNMKLAYNISLYGKSKGFPFYWYVIHQDSPKFRTTTTWDKMTKFLVKIYEKKKLAHLPDIPKDWLSQKCNLRYLRNIFHFHISLRDKKHNLACEYCKVEKSKKNKTSKLHAVQVGFSPFQYCRLPPDFDMNGHI